MVLMVIMGIGLDLMETIMVPGVSAGNVLPSIGGMLKPLNPNGIWPKNTLLVRTGMLGLCNKTSPNANQYSTKQTQ